MSKFRDIKSLQKLASIQASIHNHINHERHLISRGDFKRKREAAFVEWQRLSTAKIATFDRQTETSLRSSDSTLSVKARVTKINRGMGSVRSRL